MSRCAICNSATVTLYLCVDEKYRCINCLLNWAGILWEELSKVFPDMRRQKDIEIAGGAPGKPVVRYDGGEGGTGKAKQPEDSHGHFGEYSDESLPGA